VDKQTGSAYLALAKNYSDDWLAQPEPTDMYGLLKKYFKVGGKTIDVGSGNGRDSDWLSKNGFHVEGVDSSNELIKISKDLYPSIQFTHAQLPELTEIKDVFDNVLCETVIMHLPTLSIVAAVTRLKNLLKPDGVIYLSWRVTENEDARHPDGRLYSAFPPDLVLNQFDKKKILHFEDKISVSSGKRVCRLIARV
jgi:2-polyprenyl-3-methyl-5-hydroxy-6-metoxy-1,4-benzoquinol methylase